MTGTTSLVISGGSGDIALGSSGSNLLFSAGTSVVSKPAAGVEAIVIPSGRSLEAPLALLASIDVLSGNIELTDTSAAAGQLLVLDGKTSGLLAAPAVTQVSGTLPELQGLAAAPGIQLPAAAAIAMTGTAASPAELNTVLGAFTGSVSVRLQNGYVTGEVLFVAVGDALVIDSEERVGPLLSVPVADSFEINAPGEWHFNENSGMFAWYDGNDGYEGLNTIFLSGAGSVSVSGDVVTVLTAGINLVP